MCSGPYWALNPLHELHFRQLEGVVEAIFFEEPLLKLRPVVVVELQLKHLSVDARLDNSDKPASTSRACRPPNSLRRPSSYIGRLRRLSFQWLYRAPRSPHGRSQGGQRPPPSLSQVHSLSFSRLICYPFTLGSPKMSRYSVGMCWIKAGPPGSWTRESGHGRTELRR